MYSKINAAVAVFKKCLPFCFIAGKLNRTKSKNNESYIYLKQKSTEVRLFLALLGHLYCFVHKLGYFNMFKFQLLGKRRQLFYWSNPISQAQNDLSCYHGNLPPLKGQVKMFYM